MSKVAGTAFFRVNGQQYSLRGNFLISIGNTTRESIIGLDQYHGTKEIPSASFMQCELTDMPEIDLNVLERLEDVTIQAELINGKVAVLRNASQVQKIELNVEDGLFTVRFEGPRGEWI